MMDGIMKAVCQMGIFMICAQAILHFRPNGSYEKYMKMLVSVMILVQLFLPLIRIISFGGQGDIQMQMDQFQQQLQESMEEARKTSELSDDILSKMTLDEVKFRINEQQVAAQQQEPDPGQEDGLQQGRPESDAKGQEPAGQTEQTVQAGKSEESRDIDWGQVEESIKDSRKDSENGNGTGNESKLADVTESGVREAVQPVDKIQIKIGE